MKQSKENEKKPKAFVMTVLTRPPLTISGLAGLALRAIKALVKRILFFLTRRPRFLPYGGPQAVSRSLKTGLAELRVRYKFNPWARGVSETVGVLSGVKTLRWALKQKEAGRIKHIIAGPNIVNAPVDENKIIEDPLIDTVVVPSKWSKDWWSSYDQYLGAKITPWAAGVEDRGELRDKNGYCLIYVKNLSLEIYEPIIRHLWEKKVPIKILHYGRFFKSTYYRALSKAKFMIYLSHVERQGIALHEAWMGNVPTLIWNPGFFEIGERYWKDELMSAPYFDDACGMLFSSKEDFASKLDDFIERYEQFSPRQYSLGRFTDQASADAYLAIAKRIAHNAYEGIGDNSGV